MRLETRAELTVARTCIAAFEDTRVVLDQHYRWSDKTFSGAYNDHGVEARKRLGQLIWTLREIERLLAEAASLRAMSHPPTPIVSGDEAALAEWHERMQTPGVKEAMRKLNALLEPLEALTETFYWIAFRTRSVIRLLPSLGNFEAEGVRNVRNHLLEHPEGKASGVLITSFAFGGSEGPVVKGMRYDHQTVLWPDAGLFVNAAEFAARLKDRVVLALSQPDV